MSDFDSSSFDQAAEKAKKDWEERVAKMTPEQKQVISDIQSWWSKWFMSAGHKRLGRIITGKL